MTDRYLISRVLDVPLVQPADWSKWWNVWNTNARPLIKSMSNHNTGKSKWIGFDCYRHPTYNPDNPNIHYKAEFFDCSELFPMLFLDYLYLFQMLGYYKADRHFLPIRIMCKKIYL